jgi:hypothetical protein
MNAISKAGRRWKNNVVFKVFIDTATVGQCWRLRTSAGTSTPQPIEELNVPVTVKLGTSDTYVGEVTIRRIKARYSAFDREDL